uniref:C-type lectin domain-containing protein n=1 Tax=Anolis carolinensis TaxID=28377 RepID=A0A803T9F8_ANOCA
MLENNLDGLQEAKLLQSLCRHGCGLKVKISAAPNNANVLGPENKWRELLDWHLGCLLSKTTVWPILLTLWFLTFFLSSEKRNETCPVLPPAALVVPCPKGWIGYQRKCYYFSETEGNWIFGSRHCSSHNASLVVIDSQEEMVGIKI